MTYVPVIAKAAFVAVYTCFSLPTHPDHRRNGVRLGLVLSLAFTGTATPVAFARHGVDGLVG
jgi:hypothetical protein